jgi:voltage-gated potassium channel
MFDKTLNKTLNQLKFAFFLLLLVILVGILGFISIEKWNLLDALYMTIISITTTGFKEVHPLTQGGKIFTLLLIVLGVVTLAYAGGRMAQFFVESYVFRRRKMTKQLQMLNNHYIVCGFGRMGKKICEELEENNASFVVIEKDDREIENLREQNFLFVEGDATEDEVLLQAGIKRAKGLVAVLPTEAENVFTTLSARVLNQKVFIVSRAVEEETESKLLKAGANRVVKPYEIGGHRMTQVLLRPSVVDFIDIIAREKRFALQIEEIDVKPGSSLVGKILAESPIRNKLNIIIVAIFRSDGQVVYNPQSSEIITENCKLMVIGEDKNIRELIRIGSGPQ